MGDDKVRRVLKHVLSVKPGELSLNREELAKEEWICFKNILSLKKDILNVNVLCPSVFHKRGRILRKQTWEEICGVSDVPGEWRNKMRHRNSPAHFRKEARDGTSVFHFGEMPSYWRAQRMLEDKREAEQLVEKIKKGNNERLFRGWLGNKFDGLFFCAKRRKRHQGGI